MAGWAFWIDRGGTFTDVVARSPDGRLHLSKLLSEDPGRYADAAVEAIRRFLHTPAGPIPPGRIEAVKMGTTVATNALLERRGEPTLLAITEGHADALRIGTQARPDIFARRIVLPEPLYAQVLEIGERIGAAGERVRPLDEVAARAGLQAAYDSGLRAVAIVLMHGYRFPAHEQRLAQIAADVGFTQVSASHDVSALMKLVPRGDTTVVDAYLSPVLARYVDQVAGELGEGVPLLFMQSSGGLVDARRFRGRDAVLSGPAGGIVGMAATAKAAGFDRVIGFDMGGTSTDVSHCAGDYERTYEGEVAGVRLRAPMMRIHTVAAGGGSVCGFDGARFRVGPRSAGAAPGPACYRRGGPLTVTDCNLALGRIRPELFPRVFGPAGDQPLDVGAARDRLVELAAQVELATGRRQTPEAVAEGFLTIAVDNMASAIKGISVQRGHDLEGYVLACFGGAGGQHACRVAEALGMRRVMLHPFAGVLSAYGMGMADVRVLRERTIEAPLRVEGFDVLSAQMNDLAAAAEAQVRAQGLGFAAVEVQCRALVKAEGSDTPIELAFAPPERLRSAFETQHRRRFGYVLEGHPLRVEALAAEAIGRSAPEATPPTPPQEGVCEPERVEAWFDGQTRATPVWRRETLPAGWRAEGPAIVVDAAQTCVVEPGWRAELMPGGELILTHDPATAAAHPGLAPAQAPGAVDPVRLEVFANLFMAVAEQMGAALQTTARSVNIKERLDFSCAVFDGAGALIANAPHIPVHLGSMGEGVQAVIASRGGGRDGRGMRPGDAYVLNAPYNGGTHLPDITVIMPVFAEADAAADDAPHDVEAPLYFVAARGHHADVGGITPGSMPPQSRTVDEEGVLIDDVLLVDAGRFCEADIRALLASGPWPARNPDQNIGDLKAQVAACGRGADELRAVVARYGRAEVDAYMAHVQDNAEASVRQAIGALKDGGFRYEMDDGAAIEVRITVDPSERSAVVDFTGASPQRDNNFNAPFSVCRAAVLYVFRTLVADAMPLNDGCLRPIRIVAPVGCMVNARYPAAVVAGNVETSQVITDALYGALGLQAAAQGTMNNLTFGDGRMQYYETICGGAGAGPGYAGASAVQTHMTNSRLTDPEVLEHRFPVRVERFAVRRGSGGRGASPGGCGVSRTLRFLQPMTAALLSNRRRVPPFGLGGGDHGAPGAGWVARADGRRHPLGSTEVVDLAAGDALIIDTPGGGGFGSPNE